jgi:hypothetical protein
MAGWMKKRILLSISETFAMQLNWFQRVTKKNSYTIHRISI